MTKKDRIGTMNPDSSEREKNNPIAFPLFLAIPVAIRKSALAIFLRL
jgi:hypothetical protein